ncbi:MAG: hypothetical protein Q9159_000924 [Coniocarpon cinnabarinum]
MASTNGDANEVDGVAPPESMTDRRYSTATKAIHGDDHLNRLPDVAPVIHTATTFRYDDDPDQLTPVADWKAFKDQSQTPTDAHVYSRILAPNTTRLESLLSSLMNGRAMTYSSGLSAFHALLIHVHPERIAIGDGYHGCHGVLGIHQRLTGCRKLDLHASDADWDAAGLGKGDLVHVETPLNPTGDAYDLSSFAERAHKRGAYLSVDATFAPPPLQDPFAHGADIVMHSGTKYIGGHSDMLCGILAVRDDERWWSLYHDRKYLGSVMGNLEGWLGLRSMRTLEMRVKRQSENATELVRRIYSALQGDASGNNGEVDGLDRDPKTTTKSVTPDSEAIIRNTILTITHASIQAQKEPSAAAWLPKQMPNGYGPVFAITMKDTKMAKTLPSQLDLFHHATSLGGVESLIEWRRMSDSGVDERLMRLSIGIEDIEDLWADLMRGLKKVSKP